MDKNNEYGLFEIQTQLLILLKKFDDFCCSNGIKYSVSDGSLIGVVREKGIIPWDDDVDVMMSRKEYIKFKGVIHKATDFTCHKRLWIDRIQLAGSKSVSEKSTYVPTIDVMVYDYASKSKLKNSCQVFLVKVLQGMMKEDNDLSKYNFIGKCLIIITRFLGYFFSQKMKEKMYDSIAQIGNKTINPDYCICLYNSFKYLNRKYNARVLNEYERAQFENIDVYKVKYHHDILSIVYGDYMTPPSQDARQPKHS